MSVFAHINVFLSSSQLEGHYLGLAPCPREAENTVTTIPHCLQFTLLHTGLSASVICVFLDSCLQQLRKFHLRLRVSKLCVSCSLSFHLPCTLKLSHPLCSLGSSQTVSLIPPVRSPVFGETVSQTLKTLAMLYQCVPEQLKTRVPERN